MDKKQIIERIRKRWPLMRDADHENRTKALWDMKFLNLKGHQWQDVPGADQRGDRPKYEFNELKVKAKRIINEMRSNRPQAKVRAVEDGDKETADVMEGLVRNIQSVNKADHITDYAANYQVGGGMGAWRIDTDYATDSVADQDIKIKAILNPFCLWWDPASRDQLKRDARDWFLTERISKDEYEERWPNKEVVSIEADMAFDSDHDWNEGSEVRIGEYWWKEPAKKTLHLLKDGKTVDAKDYDGPKQNIKTSREVKCHKIMMAIIGGGDSILEGPVEWAGSMFPFVVVFGEYVIIDGKVEWWGLTRDGIDAQQGFNSAMTSIVETINMSPQSKFWVTAEQAKGNLKTWAQAHKENLPFLVYNHDARAPGAPQRMGSPDVPVALIQLAGMMRDNLKAVTGVFDASLGVQSNETSGRAISARQHQGEIANFHYQDNMALGEAYSCEIVIDLIPKIYDAERSIRILGSDLAEKYVKINSVDPQTGKALNDLSRGKFDLTVTVGPSWSTRRQEAADVYTELGRSNPAVWQVAGDLLFSAMDLPYADKIGERMKALLPSQIQQTLQEGKQIPPEVQQIMQQAQAAMQQVEQQGQMVQAAAAEAEKGKTEAEKAQLGVKSLLADLEVERARFDANVEKQMAAIATKQAAMTVAAAQLETKLSQVEHQQVKDEFEVESSQAAVNIQNMAQQFQQTAAEIMQAMQAKEQQLNGRIDQEISMLMQSPQPAEPAPVQEVPA